MKHSLALRLSRRGRCQPEGQWPLGNLAWGHDPFGVEWKSLPVIRSCGHLRDRGLGRPLASAVPPRRPGAVQTGPPRPPSGCGAAGACQCSRCYDAGFGQVIQVAVTRPTISIWAARVRVRPGRS